MIQPDEIELGELLGTGVTATVYRGIWNHHHVAVKKFNFEFLNKKEFRSEITIMSILNHPNIIPCYGGYEQNKNYYMVLQFFPCGNLSELLHGISSDVVVMMENQSQSSFLMPSIPVGDLQSFESRLKIVLDVAEAVRYLHAMNIIHRDLKAENLLVDQNLSISLADFGISCLRGKRTSKAMGTPRYMAPELLEGKPYDEKVDIFSFGILCWEILARSIPYDNEGFSAW